MLGLLCAGCGGNPYLEASLDPAKFEGKDQAWFEENWGKPSAKSSRFFGGESWIYSRIAGGETTFPFFNFSPNQCQISLDFDKEGKPIKNKAMSGNIDMLSGLLFEVDIDVDMNDLTGSITKSFLLKAFGSTQEVGGSKYYTLFWMPMRFSNKSIEPIVTTPVD